MYMNQMQQLVWSILKINVYIRIMLAEKTLLEHTFLWSEVKTAIIDKPWRKRFNLCPLSLGNNWNVLSLDFKIKLPDEKSVSFTKLKTPLQGTCGSIFSQTEPFLAWRKTFSSQTYIFQNYCFTCRTVMTNTKQVVKVSPYQYHDKYLKNLHPAITDYMMLSENKKACTLPIMFYVMFIVHAYRFVKIGGKRVLQRFLMIAFSTCYFQGLLVSSVWLFSIFYQFPLTLFLIFLFAESKLKSRPLWDRVKKHMQVEM